MELKIKKKFRKKFPNFYNLIKPPFQFIYELPLKIYAITSKSTLHINKYYDKDFFYNQLDIKTQSTDLIAKLIYDAFKPESVIDVGCGIGIFLKSFQKLGVKKIFGIDGSKAAIKYNLIDKKFLKLEDFNYDSDMIGSWDLCICFEVAEHLPESSSDKLVKRLINISDKICFTAAIPGQGGRHHINEQPNEYWIRKFADNGYYFDKDQTDQLRNVMSEKKVVPWIANNIMIFLNSKNN